MKQSESIAKLAPALVAAQADIKGVEKDATNPHFKNKYASLDGIMAAVRPALAKHGLAIMQGATVPETNEGVLTGFSLETVILHTSGEWVSNAVFIPIEKASSQGAGSGISYGRRYGVSALLALTTDEDDDGESATNHAPQRRATPNNPPAASKPVERVKGPADAEAKLEGAAGFIMPFGKTKGKQLGHIPMDSLRGAVDWVHGNAPGKFADFIAAAEELLGTTLPTDPGDDLPFN